MKIKFRQLPGLPYSPGALCAGPNGGRRGGGGAHRSSCLLIQWGIHAATLISPSLTITSSVLRGSLLLVAGIYQWTPLKYTCLSQCQTPLGVILGHWRDGTVGAFNMGLRHGAFCSGWLPLRRLFWWRRWRLPAIPRVGVERCPGLKETAVSPNDWTRVFTPSLQPVAQTSRCFHCGQIWSRGGSPCECSSWGML